ncbi:MAG: S-layer homology domain-containing protein [Clostridia bacterium]|nr:S-layer homology domain-containing protein [Clostridia bacterium]
MKKILILLCILMMVTTTVYAENNEEKIFAPSITVDSSIAGKIVVTVPDEADNAAVLAEKKPTLSIPCDFEKAYVEFDSEKLESTLQNGEITFTVEKVGNYVIVEGEFIDDKEESSGDNANINDGSGSSGTVQRPSSSGGSSGRKPQKEVQEKVEWKNPFKDVNEKDWFYEAIKFANEKELFNGVSEDEFAPHEGMTRGMLVTVLWRLEKNPVVNYLMMYEDVNQEEYYGEAIRWATSEKIVNGYSKTLFGPDELITREDIVTILYRYAKYKDAEINPFENNDISVYRDYSAISEYAMPAFKWSCGSEIIKGVSDTQLAPKEFADRAEVATMIMRFIEK